MDDLTLTGVWISVYTDEPTEMPGAGWKLRVVAIHEGDRLTVRSVPEEKLDVSMDLAVDGVTVTGTWETRTRHGNYYYGGARYHGAVQMIADPFGRRMDGRWVGVSQDWSTIKTGAWSLVRPENPLDLDD